MSAETFSYIWPVIVSSLFFIVWCVRLEAKVLTLERDHIKKEAADEKKDETLWAKMDSLQTSMNQMLLLVGELKGKIEK